MLLTRCPRCQTQFRVTKELLAKAGGQARCGRCSHVFDAVKELRTPLSVETEPPRAAVDHDSLSRTDEFLISEIAAELAREAAGEIEAAANPPPEALAPTEHAEPPVTSAQEAVAESAENELRLDVAQEIELSGESAFGLDEEEEEEEALAPAQIVIAEQPPPASSEGPTVPPAIAPQETISAEEVDAVLGPEAGPQAPEDDTFEWLSEEHPEQPAQRRWWTAASVLALAVLGLQVVHHARAELAANALVGPLLRAVYTRLGIELHPQWDIGQYQIVDWVATAEPAVHGQSSLRITARIHNRGPRAQPYPRVRLELTDRWDMTVGSRVFEPREYMTDAASRTALMAAGETVEAALNVVDPGPDAYGFELDVCIDADASLTCATDQVFR
jgi:predicted Zn finger-like uncharacterized protein